MNRIEILITGVGADYGFSEEEPEYIMNYDIRLRSSSYAGQVKCRMGKVWQEGGVW